MIRKQTAKPAPQDAGLQAGKSIPLGILGAMLLQTLTAIWWAAKLDARVQTQERWANQHADMSQTLALLEERTRHLQEDVNELEVEVRRH